MYFLSLLFVLHAQHNMKLPFYDPLIAYPQGAVPVWSPLYDWISALPSYILSLGNPSDKMVLLVAMSMNVLFAMVELFFIGFMVYKTMKNIPIAILSGLLAGITLSQVKYTRLVIMDHNSILLALLAIALYQTSILAGKMHSYTFIRDVLPHAIVLASLFWAWPGSYLYVAAIFCCQGLYSILSGKRSLVSILVLAYALSAVFILPLALVHYRFNKDIARFEYVSFLAVLFQFVLALMFYILGKLFEFKTCISKSIIMLKIIAAVFIVLIIAYAVMEPLKEGLQFAGPQNKVLSTILESKSIFFLTKGPLEVFSAKKSITTLSYLLFLFPVALCAIIIRWTRIPLELYSIVIVLSFFYGILMVYQVKYSIEFSIPFGIILAVFLGDIIRKLPSKFMP